MCYLYFIYYRLYTLNLIWLFQKNKILKLLIKNKECVALFQYNNLQTFPLIYKSPTATLLFPITKEAVNIAANDTGGRFLSPTLSLEVTPLKLLMRNRYRPSNTTSCNDFFCQLSCQQRIKKNRERADDVDEQLVAAEYLFFVDVIVLLLSILNRQSDWKPSGMVELIMSHNRLLFQLFLNDRKI